MYFDKLIKKTPIRFNFRTLIRCNHDYRLMERREDLDDNIIIPYIEPIFRFCRKRLSNRYDAEDLASEIICYILDGMKKYKTHLSTQKHRAKD